MIYLGWIVLAIALVPALMVLRNRRLFHPPAPDVDLAEQWRTGRPTVSVLIPARDEAESISHSVNAALNSHGVDVEVIVLDDASSDATPDIVSAIAGRDTRVRLIRGCPLPGGWNGKQHACWQLASAAQHALLMFLDADVRLEREGMARLVAEKQRTGVDLLSTFPYQETETFWERLLIPMMHFILLGFLPIDRMRRSTDPSLAAGCGQLFLTDRWSYDRSGSHAAIRSTRHDGLMLPRAYRRAGLSTDVCDGTRIARCRMYHDAGQVFDGLLKNASEGIANPRLIVPFTVLLLGGSVLPLVLLLASPALVPDPPVLTLLAGATVVGWLPRWICAYDFSQSRLGALLHPLAVAVFVALQWMALVNQLCGRRVPWRGRSHS